MINLKKVKESGWEEVLPQDKYLEKVVGFYKVIIYFCPTEFVVAVYRQNVIISRDTGFREFESAYELAQEKIKLLEYL